MRKVIKTGLAGVLVLGMTMAASATVVVDFTPSGSTINARAADTDTTTGDTWDFSDTTALITDSGGTNATLYGGLQASWSVELDYAPYIRHLASPASVQMYVNPANGSDTHLIGMLVWPQAAFINGGSTNQLGFSASDSLSVNLTQLVGYVGMREIRFVVKQAGVYYVTDQVKTDTTTGLYSIDPAVSENWAPISADGFYTIGSFAAVAFTNIQAVGLYVDYAKSGNSVLIRFDDFQATASEEAVLPPDEEPTGNAISIDGTNVVVSWSGTNSVTYDVQRREDLLSGSWSNIVADIWGLDTNLSASLFSDLPTAFYRIVETALSPAEDLNATNALTVLQPYNILFIGDSNTQGELTMSWIVKMLRERAGYAGTGYRSFYRSVALGWGNPSAHPGFSMVESATGWSHYDMAPGTGLSTPYISPDGTALVSTNTNADVTITFTGDAIDLYYLQQVATSRRFSFEIDGNAPVTNETGSTEQKAMLHAVSGLSAGSHTIVVTALDEDVVLLGFDVKDSSGDPRVICHKWGNGSAHSGHYVDIDENIFQEMVDLLGPDLVLIILGTNDHNIGGFSKEQFAANLEEMVRRIKVALPAVDILLLSTFRSNTQAGQPGGLLDEYKDYSYPLSAENSGSDYWDMSTFFEDKYGFWPGSSSTGYYTGEPTYAYPPYIMRDNYHVDLDGGGYIAEGLWYQIVNRYGDQFLIAE